MGDRPYFMLAASEITIASSDRHDSQPKALRQLPFSPFLFLPSLFIFLSQLSGGWSRGLRGPPSASMACLWPMPASPPATASPLLPLLPSLSPFSLFLLPVRLFSFVSVRIGPVWYGSIPIHTVGRSTRAPIPSSRTLMAMIVKVYESPRSYG